MSDIIGLHNLVDDEFTMGRRHSLINTEIARDVKGISPLAKDTEYSASDEEDDDDFILSVQDIRIDPTEDDSVIPLNRKQNSNTVGLNEGPEELIGKLYEWKDYLKSGSDQKDTKPTDSVNKNTAGKSRREQVSRLKEYLKTDEKRMLAEATWGKEAVDQIKQLNELKAVLEHQLQSGGTSAQTTTVQQKLEVKVQELTDLKAQYTQAEHDIENAKHQLSHSQEQANNFENELEQADQNRRRMFEDLQQEKVSLTSVDNELKQVKRAITQVQTNNNEMTNKIHHLSEDLGNLSCINNTLETRLELERSSITQAEQTYRAAVDELGEKNAFVTLLEGDLTEGKRVLGEIEQENVELNGIVESLNNNVNKLTTMNSQLENTLDGEQSTIAGERLVLAQTLEELSVATQRLELMKNEHSMLWNNLGAEKKTAEQLRAEIDREEKLVKKLTQETITTEQKIETQKGQIEMMKDKIEMIRKEKNRMFEEYDEISAKLHEKDKALRELRKTSDHKIETIKRVVHQQQCQSELDNESFERDLQDLQHEISYLNAELAQKEDLLQKYTRALQEMQEVSMYSFFKSTNIE